MQRPSWHPTSAQQSGQLFAKFHIQCPQCWQQCCVQDADITQPAVHSLFFSYCCRKQQEHDEPPHCFPPPTCWETGTIQSESLCSPRGSPVSELRNRSSRGRALRPPHSCALKPAACLFATLMHCELTPYALHGLCRTPQPFWHIW